MILLSHPTGNANVRAVAEALRRHDMLFRFATCIALPRFFSARRVFDLPAAKIWRRPLREMMRHIASRFGWRALVRHELGWASMDAVGRDLDAFVARKILHEAAQITGVYCYEDFALRTFEAAQKREIRRNYDLPIAYWKTAQALLREQAQRWPAWEPTLGGTRDSAEKLERKDAELNLADVVVTPSRFVLESLPAEIRARKRCVIAEFGSPSIAAVEHRNAAKRLRVLFAGALTQRKGLADLIAAMKHLGSAAVELVVMGSPVLPLDFYRKQGAPFTYEPPRSQHALFELMQTCDVLVLPSVVEGRALVQQEAMACGLPLIVTRNAGGEDLIEEGETGFLVPINSPEAIAEKIVWFCEHRREWPAMSAAARGKAAQLTWFGYGENVIDAIAA